jgi:hypothetical protein
VPALPVDRNARRCQRIFLPSLGIELAAGRGEERRGYFNNASPIPSDVIIRLRDGFGLVQLLSTAVPRLTAEIPRIAVIHLRDEVTVEQFLLKDRDDVVAALRGWCRMRVIACGQAELLPYQCNALGPSFNRFHEILPLGHGGGKWRRAGIKS